MKLPSLPGIEDALARVRPHLPETPLVRSELLSRGLGADVWLKVEAISPIGSFKLRGALTELLRAREAGSGAGATASSTGNHGQGVAYAARLLGMSADIFLPIAPNPVKRAKIAAYGAVVHEVGKDLDEAKAVARGFAEEHRHAFVDDGEGLGVTEGAGTVGLEIARALPSIDTVLIPMGSGALAGGSAVAIKSVQPGARVIAVQAKGSPAMVESFHAKRPVERPVDTIADGLVCREPAELALETLLAWVDDARLTTDADLLRSMHTLAASAQILVEPSGAAALAAAWDLRRDLAGRRIVLVLTGANAMMETLREALGTAPFFAVAGS
jgi:threonine dehydratase